MCERYALISRYPAAQAKTPGGIRVLHGVFVMETFGHEDRLLHAMTRRNLPAVRKRIKAGVGDVGLHFFLLFAVAVLFKQLCRPFLPLR